MKSRYTRVSSVAGSTPVKRARTPLVSAILTAKAAAAAELANDRREQRFPEVHVHIQEFLGLGMAGFFAGDLALVFGPGFGSLGDLRHEEDCDGARGWLRTSNAAAAAINSCDK